MSGLERCVLLYIAGIAAFAAAAAAQKPSADAQACAVLERVQQTLAGRRVVVACPPAHGASQYLFRGPSDPSTSVEGVLPETAAEFSTNEARLVPRRVGATWTIARSETEVFDVDAPVPAPRPNRDRAACLILCSLDRRSVSRLGTLEGVPASALPPKARERLASALSLPLEFSRRMPRENITEEGEVTTHFENETAVSLSKSPDIAGVRLPAALAPGIAVRQGEGRTTMHLERPIPDLRMVFQDSSDNEEPLSAVPNDLKPCDLETDPLTAPIGISGHMALRAFLDKVQAVTGLRLYSASLPEIEVFVGSASVPVGEAMDAVRLALEATFRRVPGGYALAWDIRGIGALKAMRPGGDVIAALRAVEEVRETSDSAGLKEVFLALPTPADYGLALTEEQRAYLLSRSDLRDSAPGGIPIEALTEARATAVRAVTKDEQADSITLGEESLVELDVSIPGVGWARFSDVTITAGPGDDVVPGSFDPKAYPYLHHRPFRSTARSTGATRRSHRTHSHGTPRSGERTDGLQRGTRREGTGSTWWRR